MNMNECILLSYIENKKDIKLPDINLHTQQENRKLHIKKKDIDVYTKQERHKTNYKTGKI